MVLVLITQKDAPTTWRANCVQTSRRATTRHTRCTECSSSDTCPETSIQNPDISNTQEYFSSLVMASRAVQADLTMPVLESLGKVTVYIADELLENCRASYSVQFDGSKFARASSVGGQSSEVVQWRFWETGPSQLTPAPHAVGLQYYCKSQYYFLPSTEGKGCTNMTDRYSTTQGF